MSKLTPDDLDEIERKPHPLKWQTYGPSLLAECRRQQQQQIETCGPMIARQGQTIAQLSTALERTVEALHHEAHSVYTSWRVCDDAICRGNTNLV